MSTPIALVGSPTALGGHFSGMDASPQALRAIGLVDRIRSRPTLAGADVTDAGDALNEPGWAPDPDPRAKNRDRIAEFLPRLRDRVAGALGAGGPACRLLVVGGDCCSHAGAMAGLRRARPERRLAIAWFDAHGDFNTPDTTPSGNVWGMPFAMLLGRGDRDLVEACDGPTADEGDAALLGGQVLDEQESRMLAASRVSQFGAGMLGTPGGMAALRAWVASAAERCDGLYIAFDLDAIDASEALSLAMPEPDGLSLATALAAVKTLAGAMPVVGFGATAAMRRENLDFAHTADVIAELAGAALA